MTKTQWTAAAVVAALAATYPASAWYLGKQIEAAHAQLDPQIATMPYLKLVKRDYVRKLFSATETVTLELPAALFQIPAMPAMATIPGASGSNNAEQGASTTEQAPATPRPPIQVTIKSKIQHGPFPGLDTFAAGRAETVIVFDEATQAKVMAAFGGKAPLESQTLYSMLGGGHTTLTSPAFKVSLPGTGEGSQAAFSGDGLAMSVDFARNLESYTVKGDAPRFEVLVDQGTKVVLVGLKIDIAQQRMFTDEPLLNSGTQRYTFAEILAESTAGGGAKIRVNDFNYEVSVPAAGEHIDMIAKMGTGDFWVGERNFGPAHYDLSLRHVHARKLAALYRAALAIYSKPMTIDQREQVYQIFAGLKAPALDLMTENPEFALDRLSIHTDRGDASLSARFKLAGVTAADFDNPMMLIPKIDFAAEVSLAAALIDTLQPGKAASAEEIAARKQSSEQMIASLVQQGYLAKDGETLKSRLAFRSSQLLVNDKPFNPMALMPQGALK